MYNDVKTVLGNDFNKSSIRRILTNKKYIGIYSYNGKETPGGVPRIIDDDTFRQAQEILQKNKKAPARKKCIEENYLLSTKISCGYCNKNIFGVSGISHTGKFYQYYQCSENRKKKCDLKPIRKEIIENLVIKTVFSILTDEKIDEISKRVCKLSEKESNTDTLKRLKKLIKENEKATENLVKALEAGKAVDIISAQIEKRQLEKQNLEAELAKEKILNPKLEFEQVKFFFERFRKGDINNIKFRRALIDTFINKIYVFEDKLHIFCNAQESKIEASISDSKCSPMERVVEARGIEPLSEININKISTSVSFESISLKVRTKAILSLS